MLLISTPRRARVSLAIRPTLVAGVRRGRLFGLEVMTD
jgi:hypothetical protein